ncbi:SHOCT domain-containing protein [Brachybacterium sp. GCM10030267]|uniref:SHOCT domain-containing protein n=1 Tax=unclassified Brachybacterium TaxID=2623841 RepID=UPI00361FCD0D
MGFIQAFKGAIGGMFADQWQDFLTVPNGLPQTAALFPAVPRGTNAGRGSNVRGSENVITNGSRILVPQGYGLITVVDGRATGLITEAGGYEFNDQSPDSRSVFADDGILASTVGMSWERFKFGGRPTSQQLGFYVSLKEIPDNKFGTQSEIYWDDAYLNAQVGAVARGSYTMRIIDPLLFVHNFVPATFIGPNAPVFDFSDPDNAAGNQLFREVVGSLAQAFSRYTNDPDKGNRISRIQGDSVGFAQSLSAAVEEGYRWSTDRGLAIVKTAIASIEYDQRTRELLTDVQKADALSGARSQSFLNQSVARGVENAGENGGGAGLAMFGAGMGATGGLVNPAQPWAPPGQQGGPAQGAPQGGAPQQGGQQAPQGGQQAAPQQEDPVAKLAQYKEMLDQGLITQEDYDAAKKAALGL